jgi:hypothetical protein
LLFNVNTNNINIEEDDFFEKINDIIKTINIFEVQNKKKIILKEIIKNIVIKKKKLKMKAKVIVVKKRK